MSYASDLAAAFAEVEGTVPVRLGDAAARGLLDSAGMTLPLSGSDMQRIGTVLFLVKGSLAGLEEHVSLTVGDVGALSANGGTAYRVALIDPIDDGLIVACHLGGGR